MTEAMQAARGIVAAVEKSRKTAPEWAGRHVWDGEAYAVARALLAREAEREAVIDQAIFVIDKELENGSPEYTWSGVERAIDDARLRAIDALRALAEKHGEKG